MQQEYRAAAVASVKKAASDRAKEIEAEAAAKSNATASGDSEEGKAAKKSSSSGKEEDKAKPAAKHEAICVEELRLGSIEAPFPPKGLKCPRSGNFRTKAS